MSRFAIALIGASFSAFTTFTQVSAGDPPDFDLPVRVAAVKTLANGNETLSEVEKATTRNIRLLDRLQKPLTDIRIEATVGQNKAPANEAVELLGDQTATTITSSGASIPLPDRYPVRFWHRPLYFEELNLERCGHTYGCATNVVSSVHFLTNTAMLPYRMATQRPDCLVPSPGDCPTCKEYSTDIEPFGCEPRGVIVEATAIAGLIFLLL
jgi:hypothetical protein